MRHDQLKNMVLELETMRTSTVPPVSSKMGRNGGIFMALQNTVGLIAVINSEDSRSISPVTTKMRRDGGTYVVKTNGLIHEIRQSEDLLIAAPINHIALKG